MVTGPYDVIAYADIPEQSEFRRLVEFVDNTTNPNNTVNGLDNMDTVVQKIDFQSLTWKMVYSSNTVDNQTVSVNGSANFNK